MGVCVKTGLAKKLSRYYRAGKTKALTIFKICQVISQFTKISQGTGDGRTLAEPAATFSRILGLSNFELLTFFPLGCSVQNATFYTNLTISTTVLPLGPVVLLCICAALRTNAGKRNAAWQSAAKLSLQWIEMVLPSVSTTVADALVCISIDGKQFLRASLTETCDLSSARRRRWREFAIAMVAVYPIGFPLLLLCLMLPQRTRIRALMEEVNGLSHNWFCLALAPSDAVATHAGESSEFSQSSTNEHRGAFQCPTRFKL